MDIVNDIVDIVYDITVAPIVRYVRDKAGLSQRALAEKAETTQAVVARIESGESNPGIDTLRRLVNAAGFELRFEVTEPRVTDPVVDAYKPGVDQTLLVSQLRKTPQQRLNDLISAERTAAEFRRAGGEARLRVAEAEAKYDTQRKRH